MDGFKQSLFDQIGGRPKLVELLKHFYADVRQHELIGPIFLAHIQDWSAHIEKIADFWSGLTGGPAKYRGGMAWKHLALNLEEAHFQAWLGLWKRTCRARLPESQAVQMEQIADNIGMRLRTIIANNSKQTLSGNSNGLGQM
ncbi:MAG: group III truncated hemoglobin [Coraliomargarita sp.]